MEKEIAVTTKNKKMTELFGAALLALAFVAGAPTAQAATTDKVTFSEKNGAMQIASEHATIKAGKVTFDVTNPATNSMEHEMIVVRLTPDQIAKPTALPYDAKADKVVEDSIADLGEVSELKPGASGSLTVTLTPGVYMLLCNVAGHYKAGMYTLLHVN